ncbi:GTA-gp10 family protein [Sphingomonas adhaesiva]|uniref:GTA-gp10 family protein n=1 Tax=Sphingomonas adhaesiva TaxID=28212 RepID=UPI002FFA828A
MIEANPERGEDDLVLAGVSYRMRPSHEAIRAIEKKTGFSLLELVRLGNASALSTDHVGVVAAEFIRAGAETESMRAVHPERIADLAYEEGVVRVTAALTILLADAARGGRTAAGERKAAAARTTEIAGAA